MNKLRRNSIIFLLISGFLIWYILKDKFNESMHIILGSNIWWVIGALVLYIIYFVIESIILKNVVGQINTKFTLKKALKLNSVTKFFNGITPFASGGQPFQVYEMSKDGIKPALGAIVCVELFLIFQTTIVALSVVAIIANVIFKIIITTKILKRLIWVGFIVNALILLLVYVLCTNNKANRGILHFIIKALHKIRIIPDQEKALSTINRLVKEYSDGYKELIKNKKNIIKCFILEVICLLILFIAPLFVFNSLGPHDYLNVAKCIIISVYVFFVGSFMPMPGGAVGTEMAFISFFASHINDQLLASALISWRFITYYLPTIIGGIIFNIGSSRKKDKLA